VLRSDVQVATSAQPVGAGTAVEWLLASDEAAIRYLTRRDVLHDDPPYDADEILRGPKVRTLLDAPNDGHPYRKWTGAHWRLVSLVELAVPAGEPRALAAAETVLAWLTSPGRARNLAMIDGLARRCASQEGNALGVCSRIGLDGDERVAQLARSLVEWQWPDGGWNCDRRASGRRSSFHETLAPMWGLHEYAVATDAEWARDAAERAAELFLEHRLFRSLRTGEVIHREWLVLHYPPYWHYDVLQALVVLGRMGKLADERAREAREHVARLRGDDGLWHAGRRWWRRPGSKTFPEVVEWGDEMVTLNALRVLSA